MWSLANFSRFPMLHACLHGGVVELSPRGRGLAFCLVTDRQVQKRSASGIETLTFGELRTCFGVALLLHQVPSLLEQAPGNRRGAETSAERIAGRKVDATINTARVKPTDRRECYLWSSSRSTGSFLPGASWLRRVIRNSRSPACDGPC